MSRIYRIEKSFVDIAGVLSFAKHLYDMSYCNFPFHNGREALGDRD